MPQQSAIYGVARIRCHEKDLFTQERLMRLCDASADEAVRQLVDAGYGALPEATIEDADRLINAELDAACTLVQEVSFKPAVTDIFLMKADVHNLKLLLKLRLTGSADEPALMGGGIYEVEKLKQMVRDASYRDLPEEFKDALTKLEQSFQTQVDPVAVSVALDCAQFLVFQKSGACAHDGRERSADIVRDGPQKVCAHFLALGLDLQLLLTFDLAGQRGDEQRHQKHCGKGERIGRHGQRKPAERLGEHSVDQQNRRNGRKHAEDISVREPGNHGHRQDEHRRGERVVVVVHA